MKVDIGGVLFDVLWRNRYFDPPVKDAVYLLSLISEARDASCIKFSRLFNGVWYGPNNHFYDAESEKIKNVFQRTGYWSEVKIVGQKPTR